ncbi:hypothetical protein SAMN05216464_105244 [Mucilaginibacter pineti]|uniref:DUF541 domain-containing protein n=1 Tax=Mucilaginibacter pineti TaxID=1391627 RepID=A0A1G7C2H5_9SPHI|nr:hypothetical protein [Mucilaginibacter pineti]SDE32970.1 hypothetical protein SAMN05216464_105244 [Mucilaginibacter pineti]
MKPLLSLLILLLLGNCLKAQSNNDITINISAHPVLNRNEFLIDITRHNNVITLAYTVLDSISYTNLNNNPRFVTLASGIKAKNLDNATAQTMQAEINTLIKKQSYYSRDSIIINAETDTAYTNLLNKIGAASTSVLENTEVNKHRHVLDGIQFRFSISTANTNREIFAHSPNAASHPLLYNLIEETLGMYRKLKGDTFLTKYKTGYY